jgi:hypothetical protein
VLKENFFELYLKPQNGITNQTAAMFLLIKLLEMSAAAEISKTWDVLRKGSDWHVQIFNVFFTVVIDHVLYTAQIYFDFT